MTRARDIADLAGGGTLLTRQLFTATAGQTTFTPSAGYNPGALEVFMNGLMLLASDYTATNSSTVVLGVAANAGDEVEILTYQINTIGDTVSASNGGTFTSDVIFDENVLVGTATTGSSTASVEIKPSGFIAAIRDGNKVMTMNRLSSDGEILRFQKDGSTIGSIDANGGSIIVGSGDTGLYFDAASDRLIPVNPGTAAGRDNAVNLGGGSERFKDLYLSGGVYLGGTGAANKLDDYEEGTFTLNLHLPPDSLTNSHSTQNNRYIKIGSQVWIQGKILLSGSSSSGSTLRCSGLPFTTVNGTASTGSMISRYGASFDFVPYVYSNSGEVHFYQISTTGSWNQVQYSELAGTFECHFNITYQTA